MAQHRRPHRTARRVSAVVGVTAATLALTAGSAAASDDERCEDPEGVVVVCTTEPVVDAHGVVVELMTATNSVTTSWEPSGYPPGYWDLGP